MNPVREDHATIACAVCRRSFVPEGRQRFCSTTCRQTAWRRLHSAPVAPLVVVAKASTVYECNTCGNRYLGTQRCGDCNTFARKVGPGGCCPHCDEPVALADIVDLDQIRPDSMSRPALVNPHARPRRAGEGDASSFDAERFNEAIAKATRALDRASTIRKCHGTVRRQIDQAGAELTDMVTEARDAIGEITGLGAA